MREASDRLIVAPRSTQSPEGGVVAGWTWPRRGSALASRLHHHHRHRHRRSHRHGRRGHGRDRGHSHGRVLPRDRRRGGAWVARWVVFLVGS